MTTLRRILLHSLKRYVFSIEDLLAFGLFNIALVAVLAHKIMVIQLHQPLSNIGLFVTIPWLFLFDFITLALLHRLLASSRIASRAVGCVGAVLLTICSAAFASMYIQGNAELNWTRSVEV